MKLCKTCDTQKPLTDFYKTNSPCKKCVLDQKKREYYNDIETSRAITKARRENPKAILQRVNSFMKQYEE